MIRLFLFAGHDTTSGAMIYVFHYLSLNPDCLSGFRAEHDNVMGVNRAEAGDRLSEQRTLLNQLPYTTACIKEALRLFHPASSLRVGGPKGAWRPFKFGPRNCVGQTLAMSELKIMLAMAAREFSFRDAYDEWDRLHPTTHVKTALGDRAYQVEGGGGGSHAANRHPCRVYFAEDD